MEIAYLCDRRACEDGCSCNSDTCDHTLDIFHARNFEKIDKDKFIEVGHPHFKNATTPEEFAEEMRILAGEGDIEARHICMDNLMCNVLTELGYKEGVRIFMKTGKWYS